MFWLLSWLLLLLSESYIKQGALVFHCIFLHQVGEVSLILDQQVFSLVEEMVICVHKFEVLACEFTELFKVLDFKFNSIALVGHYELV